MRPKDATARTLDELRTAFDQGFVSAPELASGATVRLLLLRVGDQPLAVRVAELARIERTGKIVALPGDVAGRLGLSAVRGRLVPVFDLAPLLGAPSDPGVPGLLLLPASRQDVAFGCSRLETLVEVPAEALQPAAPGRCFARLAALDLIREAEVWPVLDLPALIAVLLEMTGAPRPERT
jgi:chemotaxis signal transduction protein